MMSSGVASLALPHGESRAPWQVSDAVGGGPGDDAISRMGRGERALRLYRLWLTGALQQPGAPRIPSTWCPRRVANFWLTVALMRSLAQPARGGIDVEETRVAVLVRAEILVHGWVGGATTQTMAQFQARIEHLQRTVPEAPMRTIVALVVAMSEDPAPYTPEVTDESFAAIMNSVHAADLEAFSNRAVVGPRMFRLVPPREAGEGYAFLARDPPAPGICLRERADTGAAWLSDEPLTRRFPHMFVFSRKLWARSNAQSSYIDHTQTK
jgi:hypothetical protein